MIELKFLQKEHHRVAEMLKKRGSSISIDNFLVLDKERRESLAKIEDLRAQKNTISEQIGKKKKNNEPVDALIIEAEEIGASIASLEGKVKTLVDAVSEFIITLPNMLHSSVPEGASEDDNVVTRVVGNPRDFSFTAKPHWELIAHDGYFDFERAAKITGSRFAFLWGSFAQLERAIGQFCLDIQTREHHHIEISPPYIVNRTTLQGTGQLPKFEEDLFKVHPFGYYLIPTAEVPLTNIHADEVLSESDLPLCYTALTPCFRSEAGSYGKDTKGLIRQHQFMKTEMVHFAHPEHSYEQLEKMLSYAERLLTLLELPYRVVTLCSGDTGFSSAKTYDIEVWLPSQQTYREVSSCSNCEDFQARRANIRFTPKAGGKKQYVHTLNGSGLPLGRTLVAILENYQQEDGSIIIPQVLRQYMGRDRLSL